MNKCKECSEEELPAVYCSYSKELSLVERIEVWVNDERPIPDDQRSELEEPYPCDPYKLQIGDIFFRIEEDVYNRLKEIIINKNMNAENVEVKKSVTFLEEVIARNNDLLSRLNESVNRLRDCRLKLTGDLPRGVESGDSPISPVEESLAGLIVNGQYNLNEMIGVLESEVTTLTQYI